MSDALSSGFGKFVPGFDFLQNLAKGAGQGIPQMPNLANWIAPTLNVEELEKRIGELKAVHFWLDQNSKALGATIQALEVQKMTLVTLKGMNFNLGDVANALKLKAADSLAAAMPQTPAPAPQAAAQPAPQPAAASKPAARSRKATPAAEPAATGLVDPMQLWSSLTQQFQQIAATAMKDVARNAAPERVMQAASEAAKSLSPATKTRATKAGGTGALAKKGTQRKGPRSA